MCRRSQTVTVTEYRSRHDAAWTSLDNLLPGADLRTLCESPRSQLSMRSLRWDDFREAVASEGADKAVERVDHRRPDLFFPVVIDSTSCACAVDRDSSASISSVRQGEICAFTGDAPARVLEAGHLYSYAQLGVHHEHGGLLLRRDVHRLFDDGWLAVDPNTLRVDVADHLERYPQYSRLHDQRLRADLRDSQVEWLGHHWTEHRAS